ncbi:DUF2231 domain-containing protein [Sinorhizobium meliloti]|uniref:DUF2231 domain-containing protein n=1 Tax=Rhizobium meliloti TaxID=382 RepID=UPI000B49A3E2|nr:DUF2231 domain-containing protein [Sinorhizobium meliloti]MDX1066814.1 DUF2231 domain-containing protein [Sinorhizobium medicae]ASQ14991.1 DUF2231 domain-containing protein [Sinorhizobium meliloti]MQU67947.1 DUF2231 domain-containing protein [Sinorhizobium meliloti]MQU83837.1 DUF2231 domain-containing protein [Sinorhizobium meliloti]MQU89367.1 DUF2231 domain-containing protein [Sinorhizobium meliloti]
MVHDIHTDQPTHPNPRSTASTGGHPIHPMLVLFPLVCFVGVFATDIVLQVNGQTGWATASNRLLSVGLGFAALAAIAGSIDFFGDPLVRGHSDAVRHMVANVTAVVLEAVNLLLRLSILTQIGSTAIYISGIVVVILLYSGWNGGEPVLNKHAR